MRQEEAIKLAHHRFHAIADLNSPELHGGDFEQGFSHYIKELNSTFNPSLINELIQEEVGPHMLGIMSAAMGIDVERDFEEVDGKILSMWTNVATQVGIVCFYTGFLSSKIMQEEEDEMLKKFNKLIGDKDARDKTDS